MLCPTIAVRESPSIMPSTTMRQPPNKPSQDSQGSGKEKRTRTRSGCLNCRRRRRKCDETRPACLNCLRRNETCERGVRLTFRAENAQTLSGEDLYQRPSKRRSKEIRILDETDSIIEQYHQYSPTFDLNSPALVVSPRGEEQARTNTLSRSRDVSSVDEDGSTAVSEHADNDAANSTPRNSTALHLYNHQQGDATSQHDRNVHDTQSEQHFSFTGTRLSIPPAATRTNYVERHSQTQSAAENLLYLRNVRQASIATPAGGESFATSPTFSSPINQITPDSLFDDGIFLPGSTYKELHTTLRQHLIDETNSTNQSRAYSPELQPTNHDWLPSRAEPDKVIRERSRSRRLSQDGHTPPLELSPEDEYRLWKTWVDEIASWLDKFDSHRHFQHTLPIMAQTCNHLRCSMLAVSARQIELKNASKPTDQSLALYQEAIHLLVPRLHTRTTAVIASCVVLCVLEMLSCSPKAWRRHLDGCANLIQAVGIHGFSGGVEQALFWCFARMDVCGGLIDSMKTLIPVGQWASGLDVDADMGMFRASGSFDGHANHAVYLCACVVDLHSTIRDRRSRSDEKAFIYQWTKLWRYIQDWQTRRPPEMLPVMSISCPTVNPFPTILYSNPAAISGNQLFHTACILMLQNKPTNVRLDPKPQPVHWHARQICGISLSNDHHGAWTNSIQPLWIAGRCMSRADEHAAILDHLHKIETESGWGTTWRMEDLKEHWEIEYGS